MLVVMMIVTMITVIVIGMVMVMTMVMHRFQRGSICVAVNGCPFKAMFLAELLVPARTIAVAIAGAIGRCTANALDMVMVAGLRQANFGLETQHLFAIFAHLAVHHRRTFQNFGNPVFQRRDHQGMVIEIAGLDEFDIRILRGNVVGGGIDPLHQHTGKQEIREYYNSLVAKPCSMFETRLDQRERDT